MLRVIKQGKAGNYLLPAFPFQHKSYL